MNETKGSQAHYVPPATAEPTPLRGAVDSRLGQSLPCRRIFDRLLVGRHLSNQYARHDPYVSKESNEHPRTHHGIICAEERTRPGRAHRRCRCLHFRDHPVVSFIAWLPALVAIGLGIAGLIVKNRKRLFAWLGLALGVLAIIVGIVVSIAAVAGVAQSVNDAIGSSTVAPLPEATTPAEGTAPEAGASTGTRENPAALGSPITTEDWTVVVNSYNANGNDIVAAGQFNDPAPAGSHYEVVNYTVTYSGAESAYAAEVTVDVVTSGGNVVNSFDNIVLLDDSIGIDELFAGASATGSAAFVVPDGESVLLRVRPGMMSDEVFVRP